MLNQKEKLGIALMGLGTYSSNELAPALQQTTHCYLAGIVTGSPEKAAGWKQKYSIPAQNIYTYENFDSIAHNPDIDIVYVVLPNSLHEEFVIRAAEAGKHVICEKPMAITPAACDRMIAACEKSGSKLSIGYRLHFEPHNLEMMRIGREKTLGEPLKIIAEHGMEDTDGWRTEKSIAGGGPLMDVGIYCVQACRYVLNMEPVAVSAREGEKKKPGKFRDLEESLSWEMEFPGGITCYCKSSYSEVQNVLALECSNGWATLNPAYKYRGIKGTTSSGNMIFTEVNQQALQMDDFALAIKENRPSPVPGEMGRKDVVILQAIYRSMQTGERVEISFG